MGRGASAWAVVFTLALWALPSRAEVLELYRPLAPPPSIPERPAFEELLFSFADPDRALEGGFTVPSLSLAVRSRAWAFMPATKRYEQRDALDTLSQPAQDVTLSELPAGRHLMSFLNLGPEVRVRDLGPWLRGPDSPLQRGLNSALDFFQVPKPAAMVSAGVAVLGLVHQFGTAQANSLGIPTSASVTTLGGRLRTAVQLHSEPRFHNARADMSARFKLPELPLPAAVRIEQLEVGGAAANTPDLGLLLDTRWANLRGRLSWLELCVGVHATHAEPQLWTNLETSIQRDRFSVRAVFSRQWETARFRSLGTATLRTGPVLSGLFLGFQGNQVRSFGLVGMGSF